MTASPAQNLPRYARVAVNLPIRREFDYRIPPEWQKAVEVGKRLDVPFGTQRLEGFCVELPDRPQVSEVKEIFGVLDDEPLVTPALMTLTRWMAGYYRCAWGEVLVAVVPAGVRMGASGKTIGFVEPGNLSDDAVKRLCSRSSQRERIVDAVAESEEALTVADVARIARCSESTVYSAEKAGLVAIRYEAVDDDPFAGDAPEPAADFELTGPQVEALAKITEHLASKTFGVTLLHGVTGSGKTEVYLRAIADCVASGRQAIVLVPEISLTPQTIRRFRSRFSRVAVLHSHLTQSQRHVQWRAVKDGQADVTIGARSALFAPTPSLGLIVVDEEHENSFKQEDTPRYNARDVAVMRAKIENAAVLLGSATPSMESWNNARRGRYELCSLPSRVAGRPLPPVDVVDMNAEQEDPRHYKVISRKLHDAMGAALARGEQVILFLNRRGFSTFIHCTRCGWVLTCTRCDIALTYHRKANITLCHYCNRETRPPEVCPECGARTVRFLGAGTEKVESEVRRLFPNASVDRMDSDSLRTRESYRHVLDRFASGETKVLVGTQMIAKGLDFPNVTVVGVIAADVALNLPDFRAGERTFQLIAQVAGRTGRGPKGGSVIVQAYTPEHYSVACGSRHDFRSFVQQELEHRRQLQYPPFGRLARVLLKGRDEKKVTAKADAIAARLRAECSPQEGGLPCGVLGPVACPISIIKGSYRFHIIIKAGKPADLHALLDRADRELVPTGSVAAAVDIDPMAML
ncbi:MAG TPA: primosomal protein N' [Planctomycetota bacterium]|nr:primosomal protein N' [Planctomycetota bacterium]